MAVEFDGEHAQALVALLPLDRFADDAGAFERRLEAIALQAAQVKEDVLHAIVGDDEAIAAAHIEPLHQPAHLHDADVALRRVAQCGNLSPSDRRSPP